MGAVGNYEVVEVSFSHQLAAGGRVDIEVPAPEGKVVMGAGINLPLQGVTLELQYPRPDGSAWIFRAYRGSAGVVSGLAYATCAEMGC